MKTPLLILVLFETLMNIQSNIDGLDTTWYLVGLLIRYLKRNVDIAFKKAATFESVRLSESHCHPQVNNTIYVRH